jgi:hypothetical protein
MIGKGRAGRSMTFSGIGSREVRAEKERPLAGAWGAFRAPGEVPGLEERNPGDSEAGERTADGRRDK